MKMLINFFKKLSLKQKLITIMMVTSSTAIIVMALLIIINQTIRSHQAIQQQLYALADVLGSTSTAALSFDDPATGAEILHSLSHKSDVIYGLIRKANGEIFAEFGSLQSNLPFHQPEPMISLKTLDDIAPEQLKIFKKRIRVSRDIILENEKIGSITIVSSLAEFHLAVLNFVIIVSIISLLSLLITLLIGSRLQKIISDPILNLQKIMNTISENKDYSLRVENKEESELGILIDGFNTMIKQIELQDQKLEKTVLERTVQLSDANEKRIIWLENMAIFLKHELRNNFARVTTSMDLLDKRAKKNLNIDSCLERTRIDMVSINSLLESVANASNFEAVLYKEKHSPLNLSSAIVNHMKSYPAIYPGVRMSNNCATGIFILGDESRINQLLDKLINNAVEHSNQNDSIVVTLINDGNSAKLIVKNYGHALPKNKQAMFELFVSFRSQQRKNKDNFGMGLYVVKLIAESHGGSVVAWDPEDGKPGAVFEVSLPIYKK